VLYLGYTIVSWSHIVSTFIWCTPSCKKQENPFTTLLSPPLSNATGRWVHYEREMCKYYSIKQSRVCHKIFVPFSTFNYINRVNFSFLNSSHNMFVVSKHYLSCTALFRTRTWSYCITLFRTRTWSYFITLFRTRTWSYCITLFRTRTWSYSTAFFRTRIWSYCTALFRTIT